MTQRHSVQRRQLGWSNPPAQDKKPRRLPKSLPKQWRMQPSFKTEKEKVNWLYRREQAIKRAKRPRAIADGPGPDGSWSKGWPRNPGLTGWALIEARNRKAKKRAQEREAARVGLEPLYEAVKVLNAAIEQVVSKRVIENRRKKQEEEVTTHH